MLASIRAHGHELLLFADLKIDFFSSLMTQSSPDEVHWALEGWQSKESPSREEISKSEHKAFGQVGLRGHGARGGGEIYSAWHFCWAV